VILFSPQDIMVSTYGTLHITYVRTYHEIDQGLSKFPLNEWIGCLKLIPGGLEALANLTSTSY
jgi:hypothetical protein